MSWLSEIVCPAVMLAARRLMRTGGGRAGRADVGMQSREGAAARWRRATGVLFGHRRRDTPLGLVGQVLHHASRRPPVFVSGRQPSSILRGGKPSAENFFFLVRRISRFIVSCQPSVPIGWSGPTWQRLIGWLGWHFVWLLKTLVAGKTHYRTIITYLIITITITVLLCNY